MMPSISACAVKIATVLKHSMAVLCYLLVTMWLAMALWIQQPLPHILNVIAMLLWFLLSIAVILSRFKALHFRHKTLKVAYFTCFALGLI